MILLIGNWQLDWGKILKVIGIQLWKPSKYRNKLENFVNLSMFALEKWSRFFFFFEIPLAPLELLLPSAKKTCLERLNQPGRLASNFKGAN